MLSKSESLSLRIRLQQILLLACLVFFFSACASIQEAKVVRLQESTAERLSDYARDEKPKDVLKWLFRNDRKSPDKASLQVLHDWSKDHRWLFIKLLDKLDGEWRVGFVTTYADMLTADGTAEEFLQQFAQSDSKSFLEIRAALEQHSLVKRAPAKRALEP